MKINTLLLHSRLKHYPHLKEAGHLPPRHKGQEQHRHEAQTEYAPCRQLLHALDSDGVHAYTLFSEYGL